MQKMIVSLLVFVSVAQTQGPDPGQSIGRDQFQESQALAGRDILYNRIAIVRRDGGAFAGLLTGVKGVTLLLLVGRRSEKVPFQELAKVVVAVESEGGKYATRGLALGVIFANMNAIGAIGNSTAASVWARLLGSIFAGGAGGGLGLILDSFQENQTEFDLTGSEEQRKTRWNRFRRLVMGKARPTRIHFSMQAPRGSLQLPEPLKSGGYQVYRGDADHAELNMGVQLTYAFKPGFEIGAARVWFSSPPTGGSKSEGQGPNLRYFSGDQSLYGNGYYVMGKYRLSADRLPQRIKWKAGLGVGAASIDYKLSARAYTDGAAVSYQRTIPKAILSAILSTELDFVLAEGISLGLTADYIYVLPQQIAGIPEADIPDFTLRLGKSSLGITLGLEF